MAKGFVGKDEKLTAAEKRLLRASRGKLDTVRKQPASKVTKGAFILKKDEPEQGDPGTRTKEVLAKAVRKLKRLRSVAAEEIGGNEARRVAAMKKRLQEARKPSGTSQARRQIAEKGKTERQLGVRRGS